MAKGKAKSQRPKVDLSEAVRIMSDAMPHLVGLRIMVGHTVTWLASPNLTIEQARIIGNDLQDALRRFEEASTAEGE